MNDKTMAPAAPPIPYVAKKDRNSDPVAKPEPIQVAVKAPPRIKTRLMSILPLSSLLFMLIPLSEYVLLYN